MGDPAHRILIVDDDRQTRLKLTRDLRSGGYSVESVENGHRALQLLESESFDLVLLDLLMPDMDGFDVLRRMRSDSAMQDIPVVVITADEDEKTEEKCKQLGADDFIEKSSDPDVFRARVAETIENILA